MGVQDASAHVEVPGAPVKPSAWPLLVDTGLAMMAAVLLLVWSPLRGHGAAGAAPNGAVATALLLGTAMPLALRRVRPMLAYAASLVFATSYLLAGNPPGPVFLPPLAAAVSAAELVSPRVWLPGVVVGASMLTLAHVQRSSWSPATETFAAAWLLVGLGFGAALRVRRRLLDEVDRRREHEAGRMAAEERLRIAREVHDVVGHSLAVISLQAGVAERLLATQPEQATQAVHAIRQVSRQALDDLRSELATLRVGGELAPTPSLRDLPALVASMRQAGLDVAVRLPDATPSLAAAVSSAAYAIAREALTNVARHAGPGAHATVSVRIADGVLEVEVADDGPGAAGAAEGSGVVGMRQRALALGGTFRAGDRPGGGFAVRAALPL